MKSMNVDDVLGELIRQGKMEHKGFDKQGNDLFSLTKEGIEYTKNLLLKR